METSERILPDVARSYLTPTSQDLQLYEQCYQKGGYPVHEVSIWTEDWVSSEDIVYFRGHSACVFQEGRFNRNIIGCLLAYYYIKSIDHRGLMEILEEDNTFGTIIYPIDRKQVSRGLMDTLKEYTSSYFVR